MMSGSLRVDVREKIFLVSSFIYILYVIFPLFGDLTHMPVFVPALVAVVGVLLSYPNVLNFGAIKWFIVYIALMFFYAIIGRPIYVNGMSVDLPVLWRITIDAAWILPSLLIATVLYKRNDIRLYRIFGYGSIVLLTISFLYILPLVMSSSNILREDMTMLDYVKPLGFPDYSLMHAYTLMLIPLCLMIKRNKGKMRLLFFALVILFFFLITQTAVTTSLFVSVFIFLFAIIYKDGSGNKTVLGVVLLGLVLFLLYSSGFFLWLVDSLMPFFEGTAVSYKLQDFHDTLIQGHITGRHIVGRMEYHAISKSSFWSNPLFGGGLAGGHSKILDILGSMGLVVFVPFAMILYKVVHAQRALAENGIIKVFVTFSYICAFIFLYQKGVFGAPGWLFMTVLVPCAIMSQQKKL